MMFLGQTFSPHWNSKNASIVVDQLKKRVHFKQCKKEHEYTVVQLKRWLANDWNPDQALFPCPKCAILNGNRSPAGHEGYYEINEKLYVPLKCFDDGINVLEIDRVLGAGADGEVYAGSFSGVDVAIKIQLGFRTDDSHEIAKKMSDLGIGPTVYRSFVCTHCKIGTKFEPRSFLVMERFQMDLFSYMKLNLENEKEIVDEAFMKLRPIFIKMAANGIGHDDLWPYNVVMNLDQDGKVSKIRLIDFDRMWQRSEPVSPTRAACFCIRRLLDSCSTLFPLGFVRKLNELCDAKGLTYEYVIDLLQITGDVCPVSVAGTVTELEFQQEFLRGIKPWFGKKDEIVTVEYNQVLTIWHIKADVSNEKRSPNVIKLFQLLGLDEKTIPNVSRMLIGGAFKDHYSLEPIRKHVHAAFPDSTIYFPEDKEEDREKVKRERKERKEKEFENLDNNDDDDFDVDDND